VSELQSRLAVKEKKIRELEDSQKQKQIHFIEQSKKLSQERDQAQETLASEQERCNKTLEDYKIIMNDVNRKLLDYEKEI